MPAEWQERRAAGRALRQDVPRSAHAEWHPHPDRADPVEVLAAQGESRVAELLPVRYARMAESAFAFFRGRCRDHGGRPRHRAGHGLAGRSLRRCARRQLREVRRHLAAV